MLSPSGLGDARNGRVRVADALVDAREQREDCDHEPLALRRRIRIEVHLLADCGRLLAEERAVIYNCHKHQHTDTDTRARAWHHERTVQSESPQTRNIPPSSSIAACAAAVWCGGMRRADGRTGGRRLVAPGDDEAVA